MILKDYIWMFTLTLTCLIKASLSAAINEDEQAGLPQSSGHLQVAITDHTEGFTRVLHALPVHDPDNPSAKMSYLWSSALYDKGESAGPCIKPGSLVTNTELTIDTTTFPAKSACTVTLTVTSDTGKSGAGTITVKTQPECTVDTIGNTRSEVMAGDRVTMSITCTSSAEVKGTTWASAKGSPDLDVEESAEDMFSDSQPGHRYTHTLVLKKGVLRAGNKYNLEATVTDANGGTAKTPVTLTVMDDISEGEITCPKSYVELNPMTVSVKNSRGPATLSYSLLVQTAQGQYKTLSTQQKTGGFRVVGPKAYGNGSNTFHVEICAIGLKNQCKMTSCHVPKVIPNGDVAKVTKTLETQVDKLKIQGRGMEAAVLLGTLFDHTKQISHISDIINHVTESLHVNPLDHSSASVTIGVLSNVQPEVLKNDQVASLASLMTRATDFFLKDNLKVPERFISALDMWLGKAAAAGLSGRDVEQVAEKTTHAESSGLEPGNSHVHDLDSNRVTSYSGVPGDHLVAKDANNNDLHIVLGPSVRESTESKTLKFKVRAYRKRPSHLLEPELPTIAPIVDMSFFDPITHEEQEISGLKKPASIYFPLTADHVDKAKCLYWCPRRHQWLEEGVETGLQTSTTVECKTSHFSTYTVIHAHQSYNKDHNTGWIVGTVLALIVAMILIIIIILLIVCRTRRGRGRVNDNSRSNSPSDRRGNDSRRTHGNDNRDGDARDELTRVESDEKDRRIFDMRPGSGDGVKRAIY